MIIANSPNKLLKSARKRLRMTQQQVADLTSIARRRISAFECGEQIPNPDEQAALCPVLGISAADLAEAAPPGPRPCFALERRRFTSRYPFRVPRDRSTEVRYHAARRQYPNEVRHLLRRLDGRPDLQWIKVFLREASYDSGLELLASLYLLADGAEPGWVPPQWVDFTELPVIDPTSRRVSGHHPYPALLWRERFLFPQVTVLAKSASLRLDLLMGVVLDGEAHWWDVEIDGPGHDSGTDIYRLEQLPMPIHRLSSTEVVRGEFLEKLLELGRP